MEYTELSKQKGLDASRESQKIRGCAATYRASNSRHERKGHQRLYQNNTARIHSPHHYQDILNIKHKDPKEHQKFYSKLQNSILPIFQKWSPPHPRINNTTVVIRKNPKNRNKFM